MSYSRCGIPSNIMALETMIMKLAMLWFYCSLFCLLCSAGEFWVCPHALYIWLVNASIRAFAAMVRTKDCLSSLGIYMWSCGGLNKVSLYYYIAESTYCATEALISCLNFLLFTSWCTIWTRVLLQWILVLSLSNHIQHTLIRDEGIITSFSYGGIYKGTGITLVTNASLEKTEACRRTTMQSGR